MGNFNFKNTQFFAIKGKMGMVSHICIYKINTRSLGTDRLRKFLEFFLTVYMYHGASCPRGEFSVGRNVRGANCPWDKMSVG
jgi:hypothetical protein